MGTNYYAHTKSCPHCNRPEQVLHIGKSSGGWAFTLHVIPEEGLNDWPDWKRLLEASDTKIIDEYDHPISLAEMESTVTKRSEIPCPHPDAFDRYTQYGPGNMLRYRMDTDRFCVGRGETWDLVTGEFS